MIENNNPEGAKRNARPTQRIRSHHWRKSGDRFEKVNYSYGVDGEKSSNVQNENTHQGLIPIDGCCTNQAMQLLNERWANAMHLYNDPSIDESERPAMYSGASGSSWGHSKLQHQVDFLSQLRRAIHDAQTSVVPTSGDCLQG